MNNPTLFDQPTGWTLAERGMTAATANAGDEWCDKAYVLLLLYMKTHSSFMTEDVRQFAKLQGLPDPPSHRAWGGIIVRAKSAGLIERSGFQNVWNPKAHSTPATLWRIKAQ